MAGRSRNRRGRRFRRRTRTAGALLAAAASAPALAGLGTVSTARADPPGQLSIIAGTGELGFAANGPARRSGLWGPQAVTVNPVNGNIYIADCGNNEIEQVTPSGTLSIVAGTGDAGKPTAGPAIKSKLLCPTGVAVNPVSGDIYIADYGNNVVEQVTPAGALSIVAGTGKAGNSSAGPATSSDLLTPADVAVDPANGDIYIADVGNHKVEQVTPAGILSIVAGTGQSGAPTIGAATNSDLEAPTSVAVDPDNGNLYISDQLSNEVYLVTQSGTLTIVAGAGRKGAPTGGPAIRSKFSMPSSVAVDPVTGNLYISDAGNHVVEQVTPSGTLSIVAGTGKAGTATSGPATSSRFAELSDVAVDPVTGDLYISDYRNNEIFRVAFSSPRPATALSHTKPQLPKLIGAGAFTLLALTLVAIGLTKRRTKLSA